MAKVTQLTDYMVPEEGPLLRQATGDGPLTAELCIIGESLGSAEVAAGRPFVGAAGKKLSDWLALAGIARTAVRIENVCERQPPANDVAKIPMEERRRWAADLIERLKALPNLRVVVPVGNLAVNAIMGWGLSDSSITKYRGSVLTIPAPWGANGREVMILPTLHPAAVLRVTEWEGRCRSDWLQIAQVLKGQHQEDTIQRRHWVYGIDF